MAEFAETSIREALDHALRSSKHLRVRHSPVVAAARAVADRLDDGDGKTDHILAGTFLKYMESLGLADAQSKQVQTKQPVKPASPVDAMRKGLRAVS